MNAVNGTGVSGGYANIDAYSVPVYIATATDPVRRVFDRSRNNAQVDAIRVPDTARAAQGTDGHLAIINESRDQVSEMWQTQRLQNGDLSTYGYHKHSLRGYGHIPAYGGAVAAEMSSIGGLVRVGELVSGTAGLGTGIRHALQGIVAQSMLNWKAPGSGNCPGSTCRPFVWPARNADTPAYSGQGYRSTGNVYMGSLLAIPPWIDIRTLGITDPQVLEIARALQDYGVYIVDTGGISGNQVVLRIDPQAASDIRNRAGSWNQLAIALRQLQVVKNSHVNGGAPPQPGGGGKLQNRDLAPSFSPTSQSTPPAIGAGMDSNLARAHHLFGRETLLGLAWIIPWAARKKRSHGRA